MESSTLGEFHTRLNMLLSFHCHLLLLPDQPAPGQSAHGTGWTGPTKPFDSSGSGSAACYTREHVSSSLVWGYCCAWVTKQMSLVPSPCGRGFKVTASCSCSVTAPLSSLLWNLHQYYSQFSENIQTRISQLRQPIEKELKVNASTCRADTPAVTHAPLTLSCSFMHQDFVKISKWNDVSFWSIKQSVEKTHR